MSKNDQAEAKHAAWWASLSPETRARVEAREVAMREAFRKQTEEFALRPSKGGAGPRRHTRVKP